MQVADFLAAAGVDPYLRSEAVLSARPAELAALGEAFVAAADTLQSTGGLSALAGQLADAGAVFDGSSPTDLMAEVSAVRQMLSAGPAVLHAIGAPLCELAGSTALTQQQVGAALIELEEKAVAILQSYAQAADILVIGTTAWWGQHLAAGVAVVHAAYAAVDAIVDAHDDRLAELLLALQAIGYLMPLDVDAGIVTPAGAGDDWVAQVPLGPYAADSDPVAVAAWWAALSEQDQALMLQKYPSLLGLLHGLPAAVQHLVNMGEVADDAAAIDLEAAELAQTVWADPALSTTIKQAAGIATATDIAALPPQQLAELAMMLPTSAALLSTLAGLRGQQQTIGAVLGSVAPGSDGKDRYLLEYDLDAFGGDGNTVIAIGDVDTADNVAVVVQGATHDLATIASQTADAEAVLAEMDELSEQSNAVIVYEGYDNPSITEAIGYTNAVHGGAALADDLAGYAAAQQQSGTEAHTTVIAHSYGTLTTAYATKSGADAVVDDLVLYGSPGLGAGHVDQLGMSPENVYVGMDSDDILVQLDALTIVLGWNHLGPDPSRPGFGATVLGTGGVDGHGDYFGYQDGAPNEALRNAAAIAVDQPQQAVVISGPQGSSGPDGVGE